MKKSITVYEVKLTDSEVNVNYPTQSAAEKAQAVLKEFVIESELNKTKKTVEI